MAQELSVNITGKIPSMYFNKYTNWNNSTGAFDSSDMRYIYYADLKDLVNAKLRKGDTIDLTFSGKFERDDMKPISGFPKTIDLLLVNETYDSQIKISNTESKIAVDDDGSFSFNEKLFVDNSPAESAKLLLSYKPNDFDDMLFYNNGDNKKRIVIDFDGYFETYTKAALPDVFNDKCTYGFSNLDGMKISKGDIVRFSMSGSFKDSRNALVGCVVNSWTLDWGKSAVIYDQSLANVWGRTMDRVVANEKFIFETGFVSLVDSLPTITFELAVSSPEPSLLQPTGRNFYDVNLTDYLEKNIGKSAFEWWEDEYDVAYGCLFDISEAIQSLPTMPKKHDLIRFTFDAKFDTDLHLDFAIIHYQTPDMDDEWVGQSRPWEGIDVKSGEKVTLVIDNAVPLADLVIAEDKRVMLELKTHSYNKHKDDIVPRVAFGSVEFTKLLKVDLTGKLPSMYFNKYSTWNDSIGKYDSSNMNYIYYADLNDILGELPHKGDYIDLTFNGKLESDLDTPIFPKSIDLCLVDSSNDSEIALCKSESKISVDGQGLFKFAERLNIDKTAKDNVKLLLKYSPNDCDDMLFYNNGDNKKRHILRLNDAEDGLRSGIFKQFDDGGNGAYCRVAEIQDFEQKYDMHISEGDIVRLSFSGLLDKTIDESFGFSVYSSPENWSEEFYISDAWLQNSVGRIMTYSVAGEEFTFQTAFAAENHSDYNFMVDMHIMSADAADTVYRPIGCNIHDIDLTPTLMSYNGTSLDYWEPNPNDRDGYGKLFDVTGSFKDLNPSIKKGDLVRFSFTVKYNFNFKSPSYTEIKMNDYILYYYAADNNGRVELGGDRINFADSGTREFYAKPGELCSVSFTSSLDYDIDIKNITGTLIPDHGVYLEIRTNDLDKIDADVTTTPPTGLPTVTFGN